MPSTTKTYDENNDLIEHLSSYWSWINYPWFLTQLDGQLSHVHWQD